MPKGGGGGGWCRCRGGAVTVVIVGVCTEPMAFDCWPQANHVIDACVAQVHSDKLLQSCRPIARRSMYDELGHRKLADILIVSKTQKPKNLSRCEICTLKVSADRSVVLLACSL